MVLSTTSMAGRDESSSVGRADWGVFDVVTMAINIARCRGLEPTIKKEDLKVDHYHDK